MIFHRLGLINKNQRGFTFIEVVLAIALAGIITGGITMTIFQVITGNIQTSNHMTAVRQVQSAGHWVSLDAQMVQEEPVIVENVAGELESITLTWTDWDSNDVHQVVYTLLPDNNLQRIHTINDGDTKTGIIAEFIDPALTRCEYDVDTGKLTFTVTATVGADSPYGQSETRVYEVVPRPEQ